MVGRYITFMTPARSCAGPTAGSRSARSPTTPAGSSSVAPNFAFDHAAARGLPKDGEPLDLQRCRCIINGSEPVTTSTVRKFNEAFAPYGFEPAHQAVVRHGRGDAVRVDHPDRTTAEVVYVDRDELNAGRS